MQHLRGFSFLYRVSLLVQVGVQWILEGLTCTHRKCRNRSHAICVNIVVKFSSQNFARAPILQFTLILLRSLHFLVRIRAIYHGKAKYM